jgi:hypothetical protein
MTRDRTVEAATPWIKAGASSTSGSCVEMRCHSGAGEVCDSKNPHGPVLSFSPGQFAALLDGAGSGEFSHLAG